MNNKLIRPSATGFTLIELMIVLLIVAVVSALGGPALNETVKRNRLRVQADRILTTLNLARSEAVKRNQSVSICSSSDGAACSGDWEDGWIIFSNSNGDSTVNAGVDSVIRIYAGVANGYTLSGTISASALTYYSDGSYANGAGTINICSPDADLDQGWSLTLNKVGRPRATQGVGACS
jgi:type IV fimbrial biogenesis protein FimT